VKVKKKEENRMKLRELFERKKKKTKTPERYWDFRYINHFIRAYRHDIQELVLTMENDDNIRDVIIQDGHIVNGILGQYQQYYSRVDGVLFSKIDYPCMRVTYKGGTSQLLRCYVDINGIESYTISRMKVC
jgi:hypothetical protein